MLNVSCLNPLVVRPLLTLPFWTLPLPLRFVLPAEAWAVRDRRLEVQRAWEDVGTLTTRPAKAPLRVERGW